MDSKKLTNNEDFPEIMTMALAIQWLKVMEFPVSANKFRQAVKAGELPTCRPGGGRVVIVTKTNILNWLRGQGGPAPQLPQGGGKIRPIA